MTAPLRHPIPAFPLDVEPMSSEPPKRGDDDRGVRSARLLHGNLAYLQALEAAGLDREARALTDKIEAGLARRRPTPCEGPLRAAELPRSERGRHDHDLKALDRINRDLAALTGRFDKGSEERRKTLLKKREALEAAPARAADLERLDLGATETIALAELRGEEPDRLASGAIRVSNRDAIYSLAHRLSDDQYSAAAACRDCYEARSEGLGSQMAALGSIGQPGYDNSPAVFNGIQRAKKLQRIGLVERAIVTDPKCRADPMSLQVFRAVCAENQALSVWGRGRTFERNLEALKAALDVADAIIRAK